MNDTVLQKFRFAVALAGLATAGCVSRTEKPAISVPTAPEAQGPALLQQFMQGEPLPKPDFQLALPGDPEPIDYELYGTFHGVGADDYRYEIRDVEGLKRAVGEGIHPNEDGVLDDPVYEEVQRKGVMDISHWDSLSQTDAVAAFFIWSQAGEEPGVKAFFTAVALERAGQIEHALKAYHAVILHFPRSVCWGPDGSFVWYVASASLSSIRRLCLTYPSLGLWLEDADVRIANGHDIDLDNDIVETKPGRFVHRSHADRVKALPELAALPMVEQRGSGEVQAVKFSNGHWQLRVQGQPFMVRGVTYGPTEIGYGPNIDHQFGHRWMFSDKNGNGRSDAALDAWVDRNGNGLQDADEPSVGDFKLLQEMGCNAIRFYVPNGDDKPYDPAHLNKPLLREMTRTYGIRLIAGDFLGAYTAGSGASWESGTDYTNPEQRQRMKETVRQKVMDLKDEPFILLWLLGNENNMGGDDSGVNATRTNASKHPKEYAEFLNEVATMIHELDPNHPVAIGNLGSGMAEVYRKYAPAIDIFGANAYMGPTGFGELWIEIQTKFDRPVLITEYGCDAYAQDKGPDEKTQAAYHVSCLKDIVLHQAGGELTGNAIGGVIFEYLDEWWKAGDDPKAHSTRSTWSGPMPDGHFHEEWFGIAGQGSGTNSPFERNLREAYFQYKTLWNP
ncbi:MAG TPA: hypothetical protein DCZ95_03935 [Verrucomicrobia bacterium]|nr:hypothetical protein [Verrucomicrobiota bacterium]